MHSELHWFFCQAIPVGLQVKAASFCSTGGRDGENGEPENSIAVDEMLAQNMHL